MTDLQGAVGVVTGSASGIGESLVRRLDAAGAAVVVNSGTSVDAGRAVAGSLRDAVYVQGDVSAEGTAEALVAAAMNRWGRIDVVVNNAATTKVVPHADLKAVDAQLWRRIQDVNVLGPFLLVRAAEEALRASKGCVVNVSSMAGLRPNGSSVPYSVSKAALNQLTKLLAGALGPDIRVNAVAPGLVETPWTDDDPDHWDRVRAAVERTAPMRRTCGPDEVADLVMALLGIPYLTGAVVPLDGGLSLRS